MKHAADLHYVYAWAQRACLCYLHFLLHIKCLEQLFQADGKCAPEGVVSALMHPTAHVLLCLTLKNSVVLHSSSVSTQPLLICLLVVICAKSANTMH